MFGAKNACKPFAGNRLKKLDPQLLCCEADLRRLSAHPALRTLYREAIESLVLSSRL